MILLSLFLFFAHPNLLDENQSKFSFEVKTGLDIKKFFSISSASYKKEVSSESELSPYECRQEIRRLANELRSLIEELVRDSDFGFFKKIKMLRSYYPYIDLLERSALECCSEGASSRCCTESLVEQIKLWNSRGLPRDVK